VFFKAKNKLRLLLYAAPCLLVWSAYLAAFWPGLMSPDSIAQWDQILQSSFSNNYPAFHTLTNWVITRFWLSPGAIAVVHILVLSFIFAIAMQEVEGWGVGVRVRALITAVFCLSPVNGMMVISLWKDIAFTCGMLGLLIVVLRAVRTEGQWLRTRTGMVSLWLGLLVVSLYRHNGAPVAALFMAAMLVTWRSICFKELLRVGFNWIIAVIIITGPAYRLVGVVPMAKFFALQNALHQIGALISKPRIGSGPDLRFLASIQPIDVWTRLYSCYSLNLLIYNRNFRHELIEPNSATVLTIWRTHVARNPDVIWQHQKCVTSMLWQISEPRDRAGRLYTTEFGIVENDFGLKTQALAPSLHRVISSAVRFSHDPSVIWFVWRPALHLYFLLTCVGFAAIRMRNRKMLLIAAPAVLNSLVWLALITTQDFRFQYPVYVMALIVPALLAVPRRNSSCDEYGA
jgi:hypothetical protein